MRNSLSIVWIALLVIFISGCRNNEQEVTPEKSAVTASKAYTTYFGEPPKVTGGQCYALAGFYPRAENPARVTPIPHFLLSEGKRRRQLLVQQLIKGGAIPGLEEVFVNPFPPGTKLLSLTVNGVTMNVDLSPEVLEQTDPVLQKGLLAGLGHTLIQFDPIENLVVTAAGTPLPWMPGSSYEPLRGSVMAPQEPRLLTAVANYAEEAAVPEEILVFFDRPVSVDSFTLAAANGNEVRGEYYTSVFDMAVVLHPEDPDRLMAGDRVVVAWSVTDRLGRKASGQDSLVLRRQEHP